MNLSKSDDGYKSKFKNVFDEPVLTEDDLPGFDKGHNGAPPLLDAPDRQEPGDGADDKAPPRRPIRWTIGPMLPPARERELIQTWQAHHGSGIEARARAADKAAAELIRSFTRKIIRYASKYHSKSLTFNDKMLHGVEGLMKALRAFDLSKGLRFATLADFYIKGEIFNAAHATHSIVTPPRGEWARFKDVSADKLDTLNDDGGLEPALDRMKCDPRYEALTESDSGLDDLHDCLEAVAGSSILNDRERRIFTARYLCDDPLTLKDLAQEFGISGERVRQIESAAIAKVKSAKDGGAPRDIGRAALARKVTVRQFQHARRFHQHFKRDLIDEIAAPKQTRATRRYLPVEDENPVRLKRAREAFALMRLGQLERAHCCSGPNHKWPCRFRILHVQTGKFPYEITECSNGSASSVRHIPITEELRQKYEPAKQRASEAIAANPQRSNRAIADAVGVSEGTVREARKSGAQDYAPEREGKDGKIYGWIDWPPCLEAAA